MENQPLKFQSQQEASAQLKEKIDEVRDKSEEQLKQYGKALIETPQNEVHTTKDLVVMTPREVAQRQANGPETNP